MDARRLSIAVLIALILSLCVTGLFYVRFTRQQAANRAKMVKIVAAAAEIQPGVAVRAASLKLVDWPTSAVVPGMMTKQDDVAGHFLVVAVPANEPIFQHDIASAGNSGLSAKIPNGMRAVAIKTDELNNLSGFLFPGSRVDVLATMRGEKNESYTRNVLQNIQVLSAGEKIVADPNGKPENVKIVTVLVTPEDSQKLTLAMQQGKIQLALRNQGDSQTVETATVSTADLEGVAPKPVQQPTAAVRKVAPPKSPPVYVVETIAGGKSSVEKFADDRAQ